MNARDLAGQVIVVTGGAGGLGAATARSCAERGAVMVLLDRDVDALSRVASAMPGRVSTHVLDVTDPAACAEVVGEIEAEHGRIDVVWANAGVSVFGPVDSLPKASGNGSSTSTSSAHTTSSAPRCPRCWHRRATSR